MRSTGKLLRLLNTIEAPHLVDFDFRLQRGGVTLSEPTHHDMESLFARGAEIVSTGTIRQLNARHLIQQGTVISHTVRSIVANTRLDEAALPVEYVID